MNTKEQIEEKVNYFCRYLEKENIVSELYIVGSYTTSRYSPISDVDFLTVLPASFEATYSNLKKIKDVFSKLENKLDIKIKFSEDIYNYKSFHILIMFEDTLESLCYLRPLIDEWKKNSMFIFGKKSLYKLVPHDNYFIEKILWSSHYGIANMLYELVDKTLEYGLRKFSNIYLYKRIIASAKSHILFKSKCIKVYNYDEIKNHISNECKKANLCLDLDKYINYVKLHKIKREKLLNMTLSLLRYFIIDIIEKSSTNN